MSSSKVSTVSSEAQDVDEEFLSLTDRMAKRYPAPVLLLLVLIAFFAYDENTKVWAISWLALASVMLVGRILGIKATLKNSILSNKTKINRICILNAGNGLVLGLSLFFFPYLSDIEKAFHTLLIGGLCISVVATNAGLKRATLPYLAFTLLPLSLVWLILPNASGEYWQSYLFTAVTLIFGAIILSIARDYFRFFKNAVDMRLQYAEVNTQLEKALEESKASNSAKTRFLATASHDLRQPVHTLSLLTAALMSRQLDSRTAEISKNMDQSLQSLSRQLDALLDISKLDAGIVFPQWSEINLSQTLHRLQNQFAPIAKEKGLQLTLNPCHSCFAYSDATLLERVLHNLISNAIKYTDQGGIIIDLQAKGTTVNVSISDTGIGIADAEKELVFEEFYQLSNPHRDRSKGLGLGLSIVRRLARLLNIKIQMNSQLGEGTEFILALPVSMEKTHQVTEAKHEDISFDDTVVLVIDDEENIRIATQIYLQELNCKVLLAEGSLSAIKMAKKQRPDLVIADYRLRNNDSGLIAIEAIRQLYAELPAIVISGDTAPDRLREATKANAKLLHKPINVDELKLAMQQALHEVSQQTGYAFVNRI